MNGKTIYLAGAIHGRSDAECLDWRAEAKSLWLGPVLDPMRRDARGYEHDPHVVKGTVEADKKDIAMADGVLVNFVNPSVGTSMEIHFAWMLGKPIALVDARLTPDPMSIWINYHCNVFSDLDSALNFLDRALTLKAKHV